MNIDSFKKIIEESDSKDIALRLQKSTEEARSLTPNNFIFYDETLQYLVNMISASVGKYAAIGGSVPEGKYDVRLIGRALNEDIYFPGILLLWANTLNYPVINLEIDIRPVPPEEKYLENYHVKMRDVGITIDTIFFLQAYENVKEKIINKYGNGWFNNWPKIFRFAYIIRNALAHNGKWEIQKKKGREHYQTEVFEWERAGLAIQMQDANGQPIDEGRSILEYLNGADFVVLLIEMNETLNS